MKTWHSRQSKPFLRIVAFLTIISFALSNVGFALPGQARVNSTLRPTQITQNQKLIEELGAALSNEGVGYYISQNLPEDLRATTPAERLEKLEARVKSDESPWITIPKYKTVSNYNAGAYLIPIKGLFKNTGQFAHIGLEQTYGHTVTYTTDKGQTEQTYGRTVIYIDADYQENQTVISHELSETSSWLEVKQTITGSLRDWMRANPGEAQIKAQEFHRKANKKYDITSLYQDEQSKIDHTSIANLLAMFPREKGTPNLAAGERTQNPIDAALDYVNQTFVNKGDYEGAQAFLGSLFIALFMKDTLQLQDALKNVPGLELSKLAQLDFDEEKAKVEKLIKEIAEKSTPVAAVSEKVIPAKPSLAQEVYQLANTLVNAYSSKRELTEGQGKEFGKLILSVIESYPTQKTKFPFSHIFAAIREKTQDGSITEEDVEIKIIVPLALAYLETNPEPQQILPASKTAKPIQRILVIDDEVTIAASLVTILNDMDGHEVITAKSGLEALCLLLEENHQLDAVVTDNHMPMMTGVELIPQIRDLMVKKGGIVPFCVLWSSRMDSNLEIQVKRANIDLALGKTPESMKLILTTLTARQPVNEKRPIGSPGGGLGYYPIVISYLYAVKKNKAILDNEKVAKVTLEEKIAPPIIERYLTDYTSPLGVKYPFSLILEGVEDKARADSDLKPHIEIIVSSLRSAFYSKLAKDLFDVASQGNDKLNSKITEIVDMLLEGYGLGNYSPVDSLIGNIQNMAKADTNYNFYKKRVINGLLSAATEAIATIVKSQSEDPKLDRLIELRKKCDSLRVSPFAGVLLNAAEQGEEKLIKAVGRFMEDPEDGNLIIFGEIVKGVNSLTAAEPDSQRYREPIIEALIDARCMQLAQILVDDAFNPKDKNIVLRERLVNQTIPLVMSVYKQDQESGFKYPFSNITKNLGKAVETEEKAKPHKRDMFGYLIDARRLDMARAFIEAEANPQLRQEVSTNIRGDITAGIYTFRDVIASVSVEANDVNSELLPSLIQLGREIGAIEYTEELDLLSVSPQDQSGAQINAPYSGGYGWPKIVADILRSAQQGTLREQAPNILRIIEAEAKTNAYTPDSIIKQLIRESRSNPGIKKSHEREILTHLVPFLKVSEESFPALPPLTDDNDILGENNFIDLLRVRRLVLRDSELSNDKAVLIIPPEALFNNGIVGWQEALNYLDESAKTSPFSSIIVPVSDAFVQQKIENLGLPSIKVITNSEFKGKDILDIVRILKNMLGSSIKNGRIGIVLPPSSNTAKEKMRLEKETVNLYFAIPEVPRSTKKEVISAFKILQKLAQHIINKKEEKFVIINPIELPAEAYKRIEFYLERIKYLDAQV